MNVIGHYHIAYARSVGFLQFLGKKVNHNAFRSVIVKESAPLIAGKGYEMSMAPAIIDPALHCRPLLEFCRVASCASRPDSEYPGYPDITSLPG